VPVLEERSAVGCDFYLASTFIGLANTHIGKKEKRATSVDTASRKGE
jgi:hypothetical protein